MAEQKDCACCAGPRLIFACSGAADVGAVADRAARALTAAGAGKMFCAVGIGGRVPGIMKMTESAERILALDGCPLNCVKNSLEEAGFTEFRHLCLSEIGMAKGETPPTDETVAAAAKAARTCLEAQ